MEDVNEYSNLEEFAEGSKINASKNQQDDGYRTLRASPPPAPRARPAPLRIRARAGGPPACPRAEPPRGPRWTPVASPLAESKMGAGGR